MSSAATAAGSPAAWAVQVLGGWAAGAAGPGPAGAGLARAWGQAVTLPRVSTANPSENAWARACRGHEQLLVAGIQPASGGGDLASIRAGARLSSVWPGGVRRDREGSTAYASRGCAGQRLL